MKLLSLIVLQAVLLTACSTPGPKQKAAVEVPPVTEAPKVVVEKPKPVVVEAPKVGKEPEHVDLRRLDSVATAMRAIYDQSLLHPAPQVPPMLACDINGEEALSMMMPLKARIDEKVPRELKDYIRAPRQYAKENNFSTCQVTCHCGLYASLLSDAVVESGDESWHKDQLKTLRKKAGGQTVEQTETCARLQTWFCESSLRSELMTEI